VERILYEFRRLLAPFLNMELLDASRPTHAHHFWVSKTVAAAAAVVVVVVVVVLAYVFY
jgi:heme/copper-type cytochrome/quinol oxidase subunit 2